MSHPHRPRMHRASIVRLHGGTGEAISLDDFIDESRAEVSAADIRDLAKLHAEVKAKLATDQARQHHDLQAGVRLLMEFISSDEARNAADPLPTALAEAGLGIRYLLKGIDFIPDSVPEIGMTDDARLVARILERNPQLAGQL